MCTGDYLLPRCCVGPVPLQLPAVVSVGVTVVVCPLLSLMQDQIRALCSLPCGGVPATFLNSQQTADEASSRSTGAHSHNPP